MRTLILALLFALPAVADEKYEHFQGHFFSVKVNGRATTMAFKNPAQGQVWKVSPAADKSTTLPGALTLEVTLKEAVLGPYASVQVVINPLKADGKTGDPTNIWMPIDMTKFKPGAAVAIGKFRHMAGGKMASHDALPAGKYMLNLTIRGSKTWDRQSIIIEIK